MTNFRRELRICLSPYHNCWPGVLTPNGFNNCLGYIIRLSYGKYVFTKNMYDCDIYVSECSNIKINMSKMNLVICGECDRRYKFDVIMDRFKNFSNIKFIGTVEDTINSINYPVLNNFSQCGNRLMIDQYNQFTPIQDRFNHSSNICFMRRKNIQPDKQWREVQAEKFHVDYVNGKNKFDIISKYPINFCFENSLSRYGGEGGYITEKLYDAVAANCIPLYFGGDLQKYSILNTNRILQVNKDSKITPEYISSLTNNDIEKIAQQPILRQDWRQFVEMRQEKIVNFLNEF